MNTALKAARAHNRFYKPAKPNDFISTRRDIARRFFNECVQKIPREIKRRQVKNYKDVALIVKNIEKEWVYFCRHAKGDVARPDMLRVALKKKYPTMYRIGFEGGPSRWDRLKYSIWRMLDFTRFF